MIKTILITIELTMALCGLLGCAQQPAPPIVKTILVEAEPLKAQLPKTSSCQCTVCGCPLCVCEVQKKTGECSCEKCQCGKTQEKPAAITAYIEVHTSENCGPCQQWKATELPALKAAGWTVGKTGHIRIVEYGTDNWPGSLPMFRFHSKGRMFYQHEGYLSGAQIGATFERFKRGREVIRSSGVSVRSIAGVSAPVGTSSRSAVCCTMQIHSGARMPLAGFCVGGGCR